MILIEVLKTLTFEGVKMKNILKLPKKFKGWLCLCLILFVIFIGGWPIIPLLNKPILVLGMPLLMVWSIFIIIVTTLTMIIIDKIGGVD